MAREVVQHAIIKVIQPQIVRYTCDRCGKVCGTRGNPKSTWHQMRTGGGENHYCLRTCHPSDHPRWERDHVLDCVLCYAEAQDRGETWMEEVVLDVLAGP